MAKVGRSVAAKQDPPLNPVNVRIGAAVRAAREAARIGQTEMARFLELKSGTQVWRYETGRAEIPTSKLSKIASKVGKEVAELMGEPMTPTREAFQREMMRMAQLALVTAQDDSQAARDRWREAISQHTAWLKRPRR